MNKEKGPNQQLLLTVSLTAVREPSAELRRYTFFIFIYFSLLALPKLINGKATDSPVFHIDLINYYKRRCR